MKLALPLVLLASALSLLLLPPVPRAQAPTAELEATIDTGEDLAVVAAWSSDGRQLAYGTEKEVRLPKHPLSVDEAPIRYPGEVWVTAPGEKPRRILKHDFFRNREGSFFSFSVERLAWAPDGEKLLIELRDERKNTLTLLLTAKGKRVELGSGPQNFLPGYGGGWLGDSQSLGLLAEAVAPRLLHRIAVVRVAAGRAVSLFEGRSFAAVAWLPRARKAVGVERDPEFMRPPRLMAGDLESGRLETLDDLKEGYLGGLQASADETRVSYFVGQEKLAVRGLGPEAEPEYWAVPFGRYAWAGEKVFFLEAKEVGGRTGWLTLYDPTDNSRRRVLAEELLLDFWPSPDGRRVAVLTAGLKPQLKVYRVAP